MSDIEDTRVEAGMEGEKPFASGSLAGEIEGDANDEGAVSSCDGDSSVSAGKIMRRDSIEKDADNLSLEVNFDGGSCRGSEVSSLSFQNIVLDDHEFDLEPFSSQPDPPSLKDSVSENSDSPMNDFINEIEDQVYKCEFEQEMKKREHMKCAGGGGGMCESEAHTDLHFDLSPEFGTVKRQFKTASPSSELPALRSPLLTASTYASNYNGGGLDPTNPRSCSERDTSNATFQKLPLDNSRNEANDLTRDSKLTEARNNTMNSVQFELITDNVENALKNQSVSDLNNKDLAVVNPNDSLLKGKGKMIGSDVVDASRCDLSGRTNGPKKKRVSPGLAQGLHSHKQEVQRDSSSSERELDTTELDGKLQDMREKTAIKTDARSNIVHPETTENKKLDERITDNLRGFHPEKQVSSQPLTAETRAALESSMHGVGAPNAAEAEAPPGVEVENEYDYVKYARVQTGDYVGMRLAYSTAGTEQEKQKCASDGVAGAHDRAVTSSHEGTPPQQGHGKSLNPPKINDELLTEIPLNGSESTSGERKNISLSPENTECDSTEIESVLSEEGKSIGSLMPAVEDGLSSSQASDAEDLPASESMQHNYGMRAKMSGGKLGDDSVRNFFNRSNSSQDSSPTKEQAISERKKALDVAIKDIQNALQRKRSGVLQSPASSDVKDDDPVWIMRETYVKRIQREDEFRNAKEEADRKREENYTSEEMSKVYQVENENEALMKYQFSRNDGKVYQSPKGYESDDEYPSTDLHDRGTRRRARGYSQLPRDDPLHAGPTPSSHRIYGPGAVFRKSSSHNDISNSSQKSPAFKPEYNRFSSGLASSRYRDEPEPEPGLSPGELQQGSDRDRILNSYGYDTPRRDNSMEASTKPKHAYSSLSEQVLRNLCTAEPERVDRHIPGCPLHQDSQQPHKYQNNHVSSSQPGYQATVNGHGGANEQTTHGHVNLSSPELHDYNYDVPVASENPSCFDENYDVGEPSVYIKQKEPGEYDTDEETDELLDKQYQKRDKRVDIPELKKNDTLENASSQAEMRRSRVREGEESESLTLRHPDDDTVLIEGVLFRARYLGSTTLISEGTPSKSMRMMQAQEAVGRIKAPEGENQPSTDVDLFVSTEKIMVLNTNLQEILMDHSLRTISYIADIGDIVVIMARRGPVTCPPDSLGRLKRQSKICCHVFETDEAQLIAQSIGQAFQVAYMEFLKANGIEDQSLIKEMDYQEVLNQQEIYGEELYLFSNKETQKEVIVPKVKGEPLNIVVVESGWGSMVPTVVLANMSPNGAAARCGQLNIGDQIMSVNGVSLVGLPLSSCQNYIRAAKSQTVVKLNVVSCAPVVEVCIKRPDVKYQLGFSVQNGVICSLLRGGIAERGGVRVGHRIIEINNQSVVAVAHEKIVNMLATAVGEIHMKTMPTSIYRLLTGQETPHYI